MELRQLEYLVAVTDTGGFTRAAGRLHVSQPGVSAQIRKLEAELGETLLDRSGGEVTPTAVGAEVVRQARLALGAVAGIREAVAAHAGLLTGSVSVGVIGSGVPGALPELLAAFARDHPGVELSLTEGRQEDRLAALLDGSSDLAVIGFVGDPPGAVATAVLRDEPIVAAVGPGDPLARRRRVALAELAGRSLIALPRGTGLRAGIDDACARLGVAPRVAYEAATPVLLGELAARGLGVALVPRSAASLVEGLVAIELVEPALRGTIHLAWPSARPVSPAGRALIAHMRAGLEPGAGR